MDKVLVILAAFVFSASVVVMTWVKQRMEAKGRARSIGGSRGDRSPTGALIRRWCAAAQGVVPPGSPRCRSA